MPKKLHNALTVKGIDSLIRQTKDREIKAGDHRDGNGLAFRIDERNNARWIWRGTVNGGVVQRGLGSYPAISLKAARELALENLTGKPTPVKSEPATEATPAPVADSAAPTFREFANEVIPLHIRLSGIKAESGEKWFSSIRKHVNPIIGDIPVDRITAKDVMNVLSPIWATTGIAKHVKDRLKIIFNHAIDTYEYRTDNPAEKAVRNLPRIKRQPDHHASVPYADVADVLNCIAESKSGMAARLALRFVVLTAGRVNEILGATWSEIDLNAGVWEIPAERMKGGNVQKVPLSRQALDVLAQAGELSDGGGLVFPGRFAGQSLSDQTMRQMLQQCGAGGTPHGFRSSIEVWMQEQTATPQAIMNAVIAHVNGTESDRAYQRSDLLEQRRPVMQAWADYIS